LAIENLVFHIHYEAALKVARQSATPAGIIND
jgi:hypothetical protein